MSCAGGKTAHQVLVVVVPSLVVSLSCARDSVFMTRDMLRIMAQEKSHVFISSHMVAEPVSVHGNTVTCFGEPSETDRGSVGCGTTSNVELLRSLSRW